MGQARRGGVDPVVSTGRSACRRGVRYIRAGGSTATGGGRVPLSEHEKQLTRVGTAKRKDLAAFRYGAYLVGGNVDTIVSLEFEACTNRFRLAQGFATTGDRLMRSKSPDYRSAISRYYYSMYHAMRAVVFLVSKGDDHEQHSELPRHTPSDFTDRDVWENRLKDARVRRNDADYEPYPVNAGDLRSVALTLQLHAWEFLPAVESYLVRKGCEI